MCHYITMILPLPHDMRDMQKIAAVAKKHRGYHCELTPLVNKSIQPYLKPNEGYFLTSGDCDCGTSLGIKLRKTSASEQMRAEAERKRAKGWSQAKITRWLADKERDQQRGVESVANQQEHDSSEWFQLMSELLDTKQVSHICLLLHWYSGTLVDEPIPIKSRTRINLRERGLAFLLEIEEDVIYEFYCLDINYCRDD
jgi:hypothetical protein